MADTVLVTGANGFIGRATVAAVEAGGSEVVSVVQRWSSADELAARLRGVRIDRCIHLSWYAAPKDYLTNVEANLSSLQSTLELARHLGSTACRHMLTVGSSAEYAQSDRALAETDRLAPWSVYGAAKASAWLLLQSSLRPSKLEVSWARLFNVSGPGEAADRIVPSVARAAITGTPIALTDGEQVRDFLDVRDVAAALVHLSRTRHPGVANVASGEPVRLRDVLTAVATELGRADVLGWGELQRSDLDPAYVVGDNRVLRGLGWNRTFGQASMVADVASYWRSQHERAGDHP